jgi:hypothetical protein
MTRVFCTTLAALGVALLSTAAMAQANRDIPQEDQNACQNDAFNLCGDAIPDHDKVYHCLKANWKSVSAECKTVMNKYSRPPRNAAGTNGSH